MATWDSEGAWISRASWRRIWPGCSGCTAGRAGWAAPAHRANGVNAGMTTFHISRSSRRVRLRSLCILCSLCSLCNFACSVAGSSRPDPARSQRSCSSMAMGRRGSEGDTRCGHSSDAAARFRRQRRGAQGAIRGMRALRWRSVFDAAGAVIGSGVVAGDATRERRPAPIPSRSDQTHPRRPGRHGRQRRRARVVLSDIG